MTVLNIEDVLIKVHNEYGYKININHPYIKPLEEAYCKKIQPIGWWYPISDEERFQFECIIFNMFRIGGADEEKRMEYFDKVIKSLKKLDFKRMRENKKSDCITRARLATIRLGIEPQKAQ